MRAVRTVFMHRNSPLTGLFKQDALHAYFDLLQIGQTVMKYACSRAYQRPDLEPEKSGLVGLSSHQFGQVEFIKPKC